MEFTTEYLYLRLSLMNYSLITESKTHICFVQL